MLHLHNPVFHYILNLVSMEGTVLVVLALTHLDKKGTTIHLKEVIKTIWTHEVKNMYKILIASMSF